MAQFELDLTLRQGSFTLDMHERIDARALALFGPSGSGKTTVIEAVAGLRTPSGGVIRVGSRELFSSARRVNLPARLRRVGYVPQDVLLFPHLNVRDNVLYGRPPGGWSLTGMGDDAWPPAGTGLKPRPYVEQDLVDLLELDGLMDRRVSSLSGGERQRVAIARALMSHPGVLLLDEPMAAIDLPRRRRILDVLLRIRDELSVPLIYVAHSPDEVVRIADWVLVMDTGRVTTRGKPQAVVV